VLLSFVIRRSRKIAQAVFALFSIAFAVSLVTSATAEAHVHHRLGHRHHNLRHAAHHHAHVRASQNEDAQPDVQADAGVAESAPRSVGGMRGMASYYGGRGRTASNGHVGAATCAHRSLPFGTVLRVTNLRNSRSMLVTVNDRGPFVRGRIVDVSVGAAAKLDMIHSGVAPVSIQVVGQRG
jgi:rare lipoprotein A